METYTETEHSQDGKVRRHGCELCGMRYTRREKLRKHLQNRHGVTMSVRYKQKKGLGRFACDICGNRFTQSGSVLQHKKTQHKNLDK